MEMKSEFKDALHSFCKEVGVPIALVADPSGEQASKAVRKFCNQVGTTLRILEESTNGQIVLNYILVYSKRLFGRI